MSTPDSVDFCRALADDTRQQIMRICCCEWRSVAEIVDDSSVTQPTVSHHLAILRDAGLVQIRREGRQTFYLLNQDRIAACCDDLADKYAPEASTQVAGAEE